MATSSVQNNTSSTGATSGTDASASANASLNNLDVDSFLKLMITELQHQDPLNPMDSSQMLNQIGQMRQITASDKLTSTLNSVLLGQNIASSTNLIGANITGISDDSQKVTGSVAACRSTTALRNFTSTFRRPPAPLRKTAISTRVNTATASSGKTVTS